MDRILIGDNQFWGVNHISDEKGRQIAVRFSDTKDIMKVLDFSYDLGIRTFVCTTNQRVSEIADQLRADPLRYKGYEIYPTIPDVHKYANALSDLGVIGTLGRYLPANPLGFLAKGGMALASKDFISIMEMLIDVEMKMFRGIRTGVVFIQNNLNDLLLGLGMKEVFVEFYNYIKKKYDAEAGFMTMNLPRLLHFLEDCGIENPIVCSSINKIGFRMSGGKEIYEKTIATESFRCVAMQVFAAGAISPPEAIEYVCQQKGIRSILFGASTESHIKQTKELIERCSI
ncbi:MAG: hypothetical protein WBW16_06945 [Bacteroidota bacterium]